jgi:cation-transporting ATPase E
VTVYREGQEKQVDPAELVRGDTLLIRAGDQLPVDGEVSGEGKIEVDESALTGESDLIVKTAGDAVLSGSICMSGETLVTATAVGAQSFANRLTKDAREFKLELTPLQLEVNRLMRFLLLLVLFFGFLAVLALFVLDLPTRIWLQIIAVITGSVSAGLLTLITLNYSWGAVRIGQKGGLVQQINAIESLSNVSVLCTDKTGTLTANKIQYHDLYPVGGDRQRVEEALGAFAANASSANKTSEAIGAALPAGQRTVADEVPFSSARKWSAVAFADAAQPGAYVLGAVEMLQDVLTVDEGARAQLEVWSDAGLRVLAFAHNPEVTQLHDDAGEPVLPPLTLLGIISFSDELRPHLQETLSSFTENGVKLKVISGDNAQTVAALAKQAGLPGDLRAVSGLELAEMSPAEFDQTAVEATVFGRITPQQKERLVEALRREGEYVAMMGDGVNDVLALKKANMGIAMESGSNATRSVAAMILLNDSFAAMPAALTEGQRIVNSIQNILKLFMVTVFALMLLIVGVGLLGLGFPFTTLQSMLLAAFARGIPPLVLAVVARPGRHTGSLNNDLLHFTLPASLLLFLFGILIYIGAYFAIQHDLAEVAFTPALLAEFERYIVADPASLARDELLSVTTILTAQTALTIFFVFTSIFMMLFAEPPFRWFAGGAPAGGSRLVALAGVLLLLAFLVILLVPPFRAFFQIVPLPGSFYLAIGVLTGVWLFLQRALWRGYWFERFLDVEPSRELTAAA